jgi:hypothetical protein
MRLFFLFVCMCFACLCCVVCVCELLFVHCSAGRVVNVYTRCIGVGVGCLCVCLLFIFLFGCINVLLYFSLQWASLCLHSNLIRKRRI